MKLITDHKSDYQIVIASQPTESQLYAGTELSKYLSAITGASLPVVTDAAAAKDFEIVLGKTNREGTPCTCGLKNDGYKMVTVGEKLFLTGMNDRATLYAVYAFLEDYCGVRFLTHDVEHIPQRADLAFGKLDVTRESWLEYRETFWHEPQAYPDYAIKRGFNGFISHNCEAKHGGGYLYHGFAHTLFSYVSPDEYFDTHPEYFSMIDGKRIKERTQLCMTNPEVLEITKKKLRQNIIDHPECVIFGLTQMDWYNPCQCPECRKVYEEEGAVSGAYLRFVNACAESIAEEFPDIVIDTFAYQFTRQAPKITKPAPNVCVRICSIECCFSHPLDQCDEIVYPFKDKVVGDATFQQDLRDWHAICDRMFVWDYTTNYRFYLAPFANFQVLQANEKFFKENGVTGIFEQGNAQSASGEFGELRAYIISRLMWDLDGDVGLWMDEFLTGYYGQAAAPIRAYLDLLEKHVTENKVHMGIYDDPRWYLPDELLEKANALWNEAEAAAEDEAVLARVQKSRLQLRYAQVQRMPMEDPKRAEMVEELVADCGKFGITHIREAGDPNRGFEMLRTGKY